MKLIIELELHDLSNDFDSVCRDLDKELSALIQKIADINPADSDGQFTKDLLSIVNRATENQRDAKLASALTAYLQAEAQVAYASVVSTQRAKIAPKIAALQHRLSSLKVRESMSHYSQRDALYTAIGAARMAELEKTVADYIRQHFAGEQA